MKRLTTALFVLAAFMATMVMPMAAFAGSTGRRNTALVATGTAVYLLAKGKTTNGLLAGAGAAYAWKRYGDSRKAETRRYAYSRGYRAGYGRGPSSRSKSHCVKYCKKHHKYHHRCR